MKRSSSWKNLQRTFASTPISTVKKKRTTWKKANNSKSSVDESIDFHIEDSDENEENEPCVKKVRRRLPPTPLVRKHKTSKSVKPVTPLLINTSHNSGSLNNTTIWNDDSDESLSGEQPLQDVSELNCTNKVKARSKSLLFLTGQVQNQLNSSKERITSTNGALNKSKQFNIGRMFNDSVGSQSKDSDTIIESDSFDGDDDDDVSSQQVSQCAKETSISSKTMARHLSSEITFTQSTTQRSNPAIESESSQFSIKFDLSNTVAQKKKTKNKKNVKGGMVERLDKVLNGNKSEFSFWMNERASDLVEPGQKLRINQMERSYGRVLLHCSNYDADTAGVADKASDTNEKSDATITTILCVDLAFKKLQTLQIGKIIEVAFDSRGLAINDGLKLYPYISKILT